MPPEDADDPIGYPERRGLRRCDEDQLETYLLHLLQRLHGNQHRLLALSLTSKRMLLAALIEALDKVDKTGELAKPWRLMLW